MSKDTSNLRLLGSPVNLTHRGKKNNRKNVRNRPQSALQNPCLTPDLPERYKRPFSADAKTGLPTYNNFLKAIALEIHQCNNPKSVKIVPPTTEILKNSATDHCHKDNRELCSNASDYGSEDTYISLGTKIKAKAQSIPKNRNPKHKNYLKYRNIALRKKAGMDNNLNNVKMGNDNTYDVDVKITERLQPLNTFGTGDGNFRDHDDVSPVAKAHLESYFIPFEEDISKDRKNESLNFDDKEIENSNANNMKSNLNRCLTKQQLSLVEEESTQDLESVPSQNLSTSPENYGSFLELSKTIENIDHNLNNSKKHLEDHESTKLDATCRPDTTEKKSPKSYESFYAGFNPGDSIKNKTNLSSTIVHSSGLSKNSGYQETLLADENNFKSDYSLPNSTSLFVEKNTKMYLYQPKSLGSISVNEKNHNIFPKSISSDTKNDLKGSVNHSRLLSKDFILKMEETPLISQNCSFKKDVTNNEVMFSIRDPTGDTKNEDNSTEYPSYLLNSSTKAYTSKVIEDYKKEIQAINNLHDLTLKDIKTEAISPTPLHLDIMFEEHADVIKEKPAYDFQDGNQFDGNNVKVVFNTNRQDISKVSTKELIQNYLKVKGGDYVQGKNSKRKCFKSNSDGEESTSLKWHWKNKVANNEIDKNFSKPSMKNTVNNNGVTSKNIPLSARIESVQNDRDVVSWMSMSAPSPRAFEIDEICDHSTDKSKPIEYAFPSASGDAKKENIQKAQSKKETINVEHTEVHKPKELTNDSTVFDIYSMLKEIESYGENPFHVNKTETEPQNSQEEEKASTPKDNFLEILEFLEKVEKSANDALSVVTDSNPQSIPKLETLLRLPQTELAQRLVTASLQLEERSCCIALLQESLSNHKEQMIAKISSLEKQSLRNVSKVKQECEAAIKRHQNFIDQLINDKKTLNHRIEQLVDERRSMEERWKRSAQTLEERYKLELKNQHDKMVAAQQVARQRWVRQKAEKIKELTVKGLEGELREMADRQQKEIADLKMAQAEHISRMQVKHNAELEELRRTMEEEKETALIKERQLASSRLEKQILELELTYQEQRTKLVNEMRAENERLAAALGERERNNKQQIEEWRQEQERLIEEKKSQQETELSKKKENLEEEMKQHRKEMQDEFERYKREFEAEQQVILKRKLGEISAQHKLERDREIEKAIESMESEAQQGRKELQEALRRNKEQYEIELKELAETEQATLKRYQDAQARIRQTEAKCADLEAAVSQLETRNRVLAEKNTQLEERAEEIRASCENSWKSKLEQCRAEIDELKKTHEEQMHQLYAKVKVAVARKDSAIQALTRESAKAQEKMTLLEQKLQQQRKDFLKQK